jgi:hypothetical protein
MKPIWAAAMIAGMMFSGASAQDPGVKKPEAAKASEKKSEKKKDAPKLDPTKVDVDPASGEAFPIATLLPGVTFKSTRVENGTKDAAPSPIESEVGVRWRHRGMTGGAEIFIVRHDNAHDALAAVSLIRRESMRFSESPTLPEWLTVVVEPDGKVKLAFFQIGQESVVIAPNGPQPEADVIPLAQAIHSKLEAWHAGLPNQNTEFEELPVAFRKLPADGLKRRAMVFAVGPLGLKGENGTERFPEIPATPGAQFAWADYAEPSPFGRLIVCDYPTPQEATAALDEVQKYVAGLPEPERGARRVYRQGNFIIEAFGVRDEKAAAAAVKKIEYDYVVRWLGDKPERNTGDNRLTAQQAGQVVVGTFRLVFYAVVLMACVGLVVGMFYFRWRKRHAGEGFVEADAMLRLNLNDEFSLPPASPAKRLSSGE